MKQAINAGIRSHKGLSHGASNAQNHRRTVTVTAPDGTQTVTVYQNGNLQSVTQKNASGGQLAQTTYAYDQHGRQLTVTDARNGTTIHPVR